MLCELRQWRCLREADRSHIVLVLQTVTVSCRSRKVMRMWIVDRCCVFCRLCVMMMIFSGCWRKPVKRRNRNVWSVSCCTGSGMWQGDNWYWLYRWWLFCAAYAAVDSMSSCCVWSVSCCTGSGTWQGDN